MAKMIDLNSLDQPILEIKLKDESHTIIRVTIPTVNLVERFIAAKAEMTELARTRDVAKIKKLYELTAEIMSCNADYITITAEELRDKYRLNFGDLVVIYAGYLDFIKEIGSAKN